MATEEPAADDLAAARRRRLSTAPDDELALGEDAIEMVADEESATETTMELGETPLGAEQCGRGLPRRRAVRAPTPHDPTDEPEADEPAAEAPPSPSRPAKKRGRASVPSWDEIMFGGGKND